MKPQDSVKMRDGSMASLSSSGRYYVRREPETGLLEKVVYFNLKRVHVPLAKAECEICHDIMESNMCGRFVSCRCMMSFVDTDRWFPERHRYGGRAIPVIRPKPKKKK